MRIERWKKIIWIIILSQASPSRVGVCYLSCYFGIATLFSVNLSAHTHPNSLRYQDLVLAFTQPQNALNTIISPSFRLFFFVLAFSPISIEMYRCQIHFTANSQADSGCEKMFWYFVGIYAFFSLAVIALKFPVWLLFGCYRNVFRKRLGFSTIFGRPLILPLFQSFFFLCSLIFLSYAWLDLGGF